MTFFTEWERTGSFWERVSGAWCFVIFGIACLVGYVYIENNFPTAQNLLKAEGNVLWVKKTRKSLYFALSNNPKLFVKHSKGHKDVAVQQGILNSIGKQISIAYLNDPFSPLFRDEAYYDVYTVQVDGVEVVPLEEVRKGHRYDNLFLLVVGLGILGYGLHRLRWLRRYVS